MKKENRDKIVVSKSIFKKRIKVIEDAFEEYCETLEDSDAIYDAIDKLRELID